MDDKDGSSLDLFSGLAYVDYFYYDVFGVAPVSRNPPPSRVKMTNISGDMNFVESGLLGSVSFFLEMLDPIDLEIGYMKICIKDYSSSIHDIVDLEVKGLSAGRGDSSLEIKMTATNEQKGNVYLIW